MIKFNQLNFKIRKKSYFGIIKMKANDDFLGSTTGGRRMHYDINETIDESFD